MTAPPSEAGEHLRRLSEALREKVFPELLLHLQGQPTINEKNLDAQVRNFLLPYSKPILSKYNIQFLAPYDPAYRQVTGRTHHDFVCKSVYQDRATNTATPITIWVNNKLGNLTNSKGRNDVTTYNNLLRLYLDVPYKRLLEPSLPGNVIDIIKRRLRDLEVVAYGVLVIDKSLKDFNFFLLEEVADPLYVNPRNTMLQVPYKPQVRSKPLSYREFVTNLLDAIKKAHERTLESVGSELTAIENLRQHFLSLDQK